MHRNTFSALQATVLALALFLSAASLDAQELPFRAPVPLHPAEGTEVESSPVLFEWNPVEGFLPEFHVYRLTIAGTSTLGFVRPDPIDINSTTATVDLPIGAFYEYRIQVFEQESGIAQSPKSVPINFTFPFPDPPTPTPTPTPIDVPQVDYNGDSAIDNRDLWIFSEAWQQPLYSSPAASIDKDLVRDGFIDDQDLLLFLQLRETAIPAPRLVRPADGTTFTIPDSQQGNIVLEWEPVPDVTSYTVRVLGPGPFPTEVYNVPASVTSVTMIPTTLSGTYAWRVVAFADDGRASLPSRQGFFNINRASAASPTPSPTFTVTPTPTDTPTPTPTPTVAFRIDLTGDGAITAGDIFTFAAAWASREGEPGFNEGADLLPDGNITQEDLFEFHRQWRERAFFEPTPAPTATASPTATPSPSASPTLPASPTPSPTITTTPSPTLTPGETATPVATATPAATAMATETPQPTETQPIVTQ